MLITDLKIDIYRKPPPRTAPRIARFQAPEEYYYALVRLAASDGLEGLGFFLYGPRMSKGFSRNMVAATASQVLGLIKTDLIGRPVDSREWLWSQRYIYEWWGQISHSAISAVDMALWDLAGKEAQKPVYQLLGAQRESLPVYCSGPYYPEPDQHANLAKVAQEMGYPAFKFKPGGGPVRRVIRIAEAIRAAVGPEMALMMDGQVQFSGEEAMTIGQALQELGYEWFEDPVRHNDFAALERLTRQLDIPVAYTDHPAVRYEALADVARRLPQLRILRSDCVRDGITGLKKVCSLAEAYALRCEIHGTWSANLHVALSTSCCHYFEDTMEETLSDGPELLRRRPEGHPLHVGQDGLIHAPHAPGIGMDQFLETTDLQFVETLE